MTIGRAIFWEAFKGYTATACTQVAQRVTRTPPNADTIFNLDRTLDVKTSVGIGQAVQLRNGDGGGIIFSGEEKEEDEEEVKEDESKNDGELIFLLG